MKYFISFILTLLLAGCNLFQGQQPAEESAAPTEEPQIQTEISAKEDKPTEKVLLILRLLGNILL